MPGHRIAVEVMEMFFGHSWELILIFVAVLLVFGPGKLPDVGQALGRGIREFKAAVSDLDQPTRP
jgi:sec-independent protein translocase protein TatA